MFDAIFKRLSYYKNMFMIGLVIAFLVGGGTAIFMKYRELTHTITTLTELTVSKDGNISILKDKLNLAYANYGRIQEDLNASNERALKNELDLKASREAYSDLLLMTNDERYGKDSNVSKVLKGDMDLHNLIRTISEGVKYEDL